MTYLSAALMLLATIPLHAGAQKSMAWQSSRGTPVAVKPSSTARTLLELEDDWAKALVRRDAAFFR